MVYVTDFLVQAATAPYLSGPAARPPHDPDARIDTVVGGHTFDIRFGDPWCRTCCVVSPWDTFDTCRWCGTPFEDDVGPPSPRGFLAPLCLTRRLSPDAPSLCSSLCHRRSALGSSCKGRCDRPRALPPARVPRTRSFTGSTTVLASQPAASLALPYLATTGPTATLHPRRRLPLILHRLRSLGLAHYRGRDATP